MVNWRGVDMGGRHGVIFAVLTIVLVVAAVFSPVIGFEFLTYDDPLHITENPLIAHFSRSSLWHFWSAPYEGLYIPLTYSLWGILAGVPALFSPGGQALSPALFHAANLLVHLATVLVVFRLLERLLNNTWAAVAGALFFGVHPVQVEAVAWATGMKDLLGGFFSVLALERFLFYANAAGGQPLTMRRYALASLLFVLALLSKPSAVTVPLLAGAVGYFCLGRSARVLARELLPWLLLTIPFLVITRVDQPALQEAFDFSVWQRIRVAGDALSFYLGKLFLPVNLGPDYGHIPTKVLESGWSYATLLPPLGIAGMLCWKWRAPWLRAGILVFMLAPLPVLGFEPFDFQRISTVADRYIYLSMLGPGLVIAWTLGRFPSRRVAIPVWAGLVLLAMGSRLTLANWHDSYTFNRHALLVNPLSSTAYNNLGVAYSVSGNFPEAREAFRRAVEIAPEKPNAYLNLGLLSSRAGRPREAIAFFQQALQAVPRSFGQVYREIGDAYESLGEHGQALANYQLAIFHYQQVGADGFELARVHALIGLLYKKEGRNDEAIDSYRQALREKPDFVGALSNLGVIYGELGRTDEAEEYYRRAVAGKPSQPEPYNNLGLIYLAQHRNQEAIELFRQAVGLSPRQPAPANNLGNAYLAVGQYEAAQAAFQQALRISPGFLQAMAGLAQANRQMGRGDLADAHDARARLVANSAPEATGARSGGLK